MTLASPLPLPLVIVGALLGGAALGASGCTNFDREDRIEDMRVLAIKTEPAEILYSPFFLTPAEERPPVLPLPTVDVEVEVFAFDPRPAPEEALAADEEPRGGRTSLSRQLCPEGAGDTTCRLYDLEADLAAEPAAVRDELRALLSPVVVEDVITAEELPLGRLQPDTFTWSFTPPVIDFFIPDASDGNPIPSIFPLLPRVVVEATNLDVAAQNDERGPSVAREDLEVETERAFKRIPVALDLTSPDLPPDVAADFARSLGFELCTEPIAPDVHDQQGRASCLAPRVPNANPPLVGFFLEADAAELTPGMVTTDAVPPDLGLGSLLRASPGAVITVTPVFLPGPAERYQVVSFDVEASRVTLLNRVEDLACDWYTTRGNVSSSRTALQFRDELGVSWQLPTNVSAGERDSLVLVVLDQRGGTAVAEITVEYR